MMLSLVVSVYNEEAVLQAFYSEIQRVLPRCGTDCEILFVNDGSTDRSAGILAAMAAQDPMVKVIEFSRNFGHEAAMIAGIDHASGDYIICMDADLQHPPEMIPDILRKFREGYEVISLIRTKNADAGFFRRLASDGFYTLLNLISSVKFEKNSSDFFGISQKAADVLRRDYREKVRYLRGYVQSIGFRKTTMEYSAQERAAGRSKYRFSGLWKFSIQTLCCFSDVPLKLGTCAGLLTALCGLILLIVSVFGGWIAGSSAVLILMCFLFAVTLLVLGVIGEYIAILFAETKNRPIYLVRETWNLPEPEKREAGARQQPRR